MARDEFIDGYMARSNLPQSARTEDGFRVGERRRVALPCDCGDEACKGWAMVSEDSIEDHMELYAPLTSAPPAS